MQAYTARYEMGGHEMILDETGDITPGTWAAVERSTNTWWASQQWTSTPPATLTWESAPLVMDRHAEMNRIYFINTGLGQHIQWIPANSPDLDWTNPWATPEELKYTKEEWEWLKVAPGL